MVAEESPSHPFTPWRAHLFGSFRVVRQGWSGQAETELTRFESKRAVALLAYLILHADLPQPREVLVDRIWPEADLTAGRNRLKQALSSLRRQLEPPGTSPGSVLAATKTTVMVRSRGIGSDYADLLLALQREDFAGASQLAMGEFLPGLYDEWLDDIRLWLESHRLGEVQPVPLARPVEHATPGFRKRLPRPVSSFFGREVEVADLLHRLHHHRLVVVTGVGGTGKTRLTLAVGEEWQEAPVVFLSCAEIDRAEDVLTVMAEALSLNISPGADVETAVTRSVQSESFLFLLDNAEQLVGDRLAQILGSLLQAAPDVRFLVSSRVPLGVEGEVTIPLYPLDLPTLESSLAELAENAAVRLFVDRAQQVRPDFQVTPRNADSIRDLVVQLEGMPLALELAAAWTHVVTVRQLTDRLQQSEDDLLTSRRKDVPARQRSLQQAFMTTVQFLTPAQQQLLGQLAVFRGGWSLELAQDVCEPAPELTDLSDLVQAALVKAEPTDSGMRYRMLESLRQFAVTLDSGQLAGRAQARLLTVMREMAQLAERCRPVPRFQLADEDDWIRWLDAEWENLRASVLGAIDAGHVQAAGEIIYRTEWFWVLRSRQAVVMPWHAAVFARRDTEAVEPLSDELALMLGAQYRFFNRAFLDMKQAEEWLGLMRELLQARPESEAYSAVLFFHLRTRHFRLIFDQYLELMEEAKAAFADRDHSYRLGTLLRMEAGYRIDVHQPELALAPLQAAEDEFSRGGRRYHREECAYTRVRIAFVMNDLAAAATLSERLLETAKVYRDRKLSARARNMLGLSLLGLQQPESAIRVFAEGGFEDLQVMEYQTATYPIWNLAKALVASGRMAEGLPLFTFCEALWIQSTGLALDEDDTSVLADAKQQAESMLGMALTDYLLHQGRRWTVPEVMAVLKKYF